MFGLPAFLDKAALHAPHGECPTHHFHHIRVHIVSSDGQLGSSIHQCTGRRDRSACCITLWDMGQLYASAANTRNVFRRQMNAMGRNQAII